MVQARKSARRARAARSTAKDAQDSPSQPAAAGPFEGIASAQRHYLSHVNDVSAALNAKQERAQRDWLGAWYSSRAQFQEDGDQAKLQQALQSAHDAFWQAGRTANSDVSERLAGSYRSYVGAILEALAQLDVDNVDGCTLWSLGQTLQQAAAMAPQQPTQAQRPSHEAAA